MMKIMNDMNLIIIIENFPKIKNPFDSIKIKVINNQLNKVYFQIIKIMPNL